MRQHARRVAVQGVDDLHVICVVAGGGDSGHDAIELGHGRGDEHDGRGKLCLALSVGGDDGTAVGRRGEPVGARHGEREGWEEEEFVHGLEEESVAVEGKDPRVLGLVEGEELGERIGPGFWEHGVSQEGEEGGGAVRE